MSANLAPKNAIKSYQAGFFPSWKHAWISDPLFLGFKNFVRTKTSFTLSKFQKFSLFWCDTRGLARGRLLGSHSDCGRATSSLHNGFAERLRYSSSRSSPHINYLYLFYYYPLPQPRLSRAAITDHSGSAVAK